MEQEKNEYQEVLERLRLRSASRDARSQYTAMLFDICMEIVEHDGDFERIREALDVVEDDLKEMMVGGLFTIEEAAILCYLNGSELVFDLGQKERKIVKIVKF